MKNLVYAIVLIAIGGTFLSYQLFSEDAILTTKPAKNVILMIGDGMGVSQITAGMYSNDNYLALERCPVVGLMKTHSSNKKITDSAAGATAFASGIKTYNGAIGVDADRNVVPTILEIAEANGLKTGLIASSSLTHATPASFYTHNHKRAYINDSAITDFMASGIEVFMGGGKHYFTTRDDSLDYWSQLPGMGYTVLDTILDKVPNRTEKLICLDAPKHMLSVENGRGDFLPLAAEKGIKVLDHKNDKGFFLMIEGSQIDWGGHENNSAYIVSEMLDFDKTVAKVLDFAEKDGNTLVIITADHETGGYAINGYDAEADTVKGAFTTGYHTAAMVPVFAYGPGAEAFSGIIDNTDIFYKMMAALRLSKPKLAQ
jgi:alkaline phosphatase